MFSELYVREAPLPARGRGSAHGYRCMRRITIAANRLSTMIEVNSNAVQLVDAHAACRRTIPEWIAVRPAAVPAGGGVDAGVRHHGPRQPGAWFALHDGRLFRGDLRGLDRKFPPRHRAGARRDAAARHRAGIRRAAASLRPRSSRPCAGDVRADSVLQRCGAADLGTGGSGAAAAGLADRAGADRARRVLSRPIGLRSSWSRSRSR